MKILKYLVFLSILTRIFFVIYRQSDKERLGQVAIFSKIAGSVEVFTAELIFNLVEEIEPSMNNNKVNHERLFSEQEFNSLEKDDRQAILAKADGFI